MKCPFCHEELGDDPGGFCDFCGKSLKSDADTSAAELSSAEPLDAKENTLVDVASEVAMPSVAKTAAEPLILGGQAVAGRRPFNLEAMADGMLNNDAVQEASSNRYFSVWYATNRFLLAGGQMLLDLKVKIIDSSVRNMRICLVTLVGDKTQLKRVPCDELACGSEAELSQSPPLEGRVPPQAGGEVAVA